MKNKKDKDKKIRFKYTALNKQKVKVTGSIDGLDKEEIKTFLENEGLKKVTVKPLNSILYTSIGTEKLKYADLTFILTQLSTYLKAGIPLVDSVRILEKQTVKPNQKRIFLNIIFELVKGESLSTAMTSQKDIFPKLLIDMIKTSEMTGDLATVLDDMTYYYSSIDKTKKQVISSMTYPLIILLFSIVVITFILTYIVPTFVTLFNSNNAEIPEITKFVIGLSNFISNNILLIIICIVVIILLFRFCYKNIRSFRKMIQIVLMKMPVIGKLIIYKEVAMFTKTFSSLLDHKVFITDTMSMLEDISTNVVFEEIIKESLDNLSKGAKISDAFKGRWAFPIIAYEMIVTGENTGKLPLMMDYVAKYYDDIHQNYIKRINTFIEPTLIILLSVIVGTVILSVIMPMFSFYSQIG